MAQEVLGRVQDDSREQRLTELRTNIETVQTNRRIWRINGIGASVLSIVLLDADVQAFVESRPVPETGIAATVLVVSVAIGGLWRAGYLSRHISRASNEAQIIQEDLALWPPISAIPPDAEPVDPNPHSNWGVAE